MTYWPATKPRKEPTYSVSFSGSEIQRALETLSNASGETRTFWATKAMEAFFKNVDVSKLASEYATIDREHKQKIADLLDREVYSKTSKS